MPPPKRTTERSKNAPLLCGLVSLLDEEPVQVMLVGAVADRAYSAFVITWTGSSKRRGKNCARSLPAVNNPKNEQYSSIAVTLPHLFCGT
jgi:hypothetical protein